MIEIDEQFAVPAGPDAVYGVLSDPAAVVECVNGAELGTVHEDGSIDGAMTVRFGGLRVTFKGRVTLTLDEQSRIGTLVATGRDRQGGTKFRATAEFSVRPDGEAKSSVRAAGTVELRGGLASVVEGAATTVVQRMSKEFVGNLSLRLSSEGTTVGTQESGERRADRLTMAVLLLHDFGGTPRSVRPWADRLAEQGISVATPRLPGHGTHWQDLGRTTADDWLAAAEEALATLSPDHPVVVMGISLGATLALRLAELRRERVAGVVAVNPVLGRLRGARWYRRSIRTDPDIKGARPVEAVTYARLPIRAARSLRRLGAEVLRDAGKVTQPVLLGRSTVDHVVDGRQVGPLVASLTNTHPEVIDFAESYHLVPLDQDAQLLFDRSTTFLHAVPLNVEVK